MLGLTRIGYIVEIEELMENAIQDFDKEDFEKLLDNMIDIANGHREDK